jgi:hypothetical protein
MLLRASPCNPNCAQRLECAQLAAAFYGLRHPNKNDPSTFYVRHQKDKSHIR